MFRIFFLAIMKFFNETAVVLYQSAMTVSGAAMSFLINAVSVSDKCGHNIAGINGPKLSFTESLVAFTEQR